jgi:FemAB-related protein (PEP-CTERM system-associated)
VVPTPANGGAFEAGGGAALIAAHVSPAFATAYILIYHASQVVVSAVVGGSWLGLGRRREARIAAPAATVANDVTVREMLPEDAAGWDELAQTSAIATLYHLRAWKDVAEHGYGMRTHFLVARRGERVAGILPLFRVPRPMQNYLTSGIFGAYGPIIAEGPDVERALVTHATSLTKALRLDHLHLKVFGASAIAEQILKPTHIWSVALLDLEASSEAQFAKLTGGMRNKIRKAEKSGFAMRHGHGELAAFYDVLAENMHRKGSPIYGLRFMQAMLTALGNQSDVVTLYDNGAVVSGALIAWHNGTMYVPFASSRPAAFGKRVNYMLFWHLIATAIAKRLTHFDFGTSMQGASTLEFKQQWGTYQSPVTSYFYKENGELPTAAPTGAGIRAFMRAWSHAPRALVDRLGPFIIPWTA